MASALSSLWPVLGVMLFSAPEQIIPTAEGTSWVYNMTEEAGPGARLADTAKREAGTLHAAVVYRIHGIRDLDGRKVLEFEMHRAGRITNTDLLAVDEHGVQCWGRVDEGGRLEKLNPPLPIVAEPIEVGATWDFDANTSDGKIHQHYEIIGRAEITVPAGTFQAFHVRGEQTAPGPMTIDRWFVPGVGIVKDVTETKSESGDMLRRISLELTEEPEVLPRPQVKVSAPNKLTSSLGSAAVGESRTTFQSVAPKIYARWQGHGLRSQAKIRVLWIAENVEGVAPPDYTIDEATTIATAPDSHGVFTLGRPEGGWTPGIYRVEFYVNDVFADAVKLKIVSSAASKFSPDLEAPADIESIMPTPQPSASGTPSP
jgi:hypothetical protein